MLSGALYRANDPELQAAHARAQRLLRQLNAVPNEDATARFEVLRDLFAFVGEGTQIKSRFACDYGFNISIGRNGFVNYDCVFLDCNLITIGEDAQIGPGVHIYTAHHPIEPEQRRSGLEMAWPVSIGNNAWVGGGAIICPGVSVGDNSVIGAGSVVLKDIPAGVVAAGNPCRVIHAL